MSVVAIRCQACDGLGYTIRTVTTNTRYGDVHEGVFSGCPVCSGTGTKRPPQDDDKRAQQAIEGTRHEDL